MDNDAFNQMMLSRIDECIASIRLLSEKSEEAAKRLYLLPRIEEDIKAIKQHDIKKIKQHCQDIDNRVRDVEEYQKRRRDINKNFTIPFIQKALWVVVPTVSIMLGASWRNINSYAAHEFPMIANRTHDVQYDKRNS